MRGVQGLLGEGRRDIAQQGYVVTELGGEARYGFDAGVAVSGPSDTTASRRLETLGAHGRPPH